MTDLAQYIATQIKLQSGEQVSVLSRRNGLPVHEATLFLNTFRTRGRAAQTIHYVCAALAIAHRALDAAGVHLLERFQQARFLTRTELSSLTDALQFQAQVLEEEQAQKSKVISLRSVYPKRFAPLKERAQVDVKTRASRQRYIAQYLEFLTDYVRAELPREKAEEFAAEAKRGLHAFRAEIPKVSNRAKLGARTGLSVEEQNRLLATVHFDSPSNPWKSAYVRKRNWLIVVVLLATGMRQGELLGLRIRDLEEKRPQLVVLRRPDRGDDPRKRQPQTKTRDRMLELAPSIMRALWTYINVDRYAIKAARKLPQIFVADDGLPLSTSSVCKIFQTLRRIVPGLPVVLTSQVMRHSWNERFSEEADVQGLTPEQEHRARTEQQGWSENSRSAQTYTRRHTARKGREISVRMQEALDAKLKVN